MHSRYDGGGVMNKILCAFVALVMIVSVFGGCGNGDTAQNLWDSAIYTTDTEIGEGSKTIELEIVAEDKSVTVTIHTDKDNLEEALSEHKLISGEKGPYGMYVKFVNDIMADYDTNKCYWGLSKGGEYMTTGVSDTAVADGEHYEFTYTK